MPGSAPSQLNKSLGSDSTLLSLTFFICEMEWRRVKYYHASYKGQATGPPFRVEPDRMGLGSPEALMPPLWVVLRPLL